MKAYLTDKRDTLIVIQRHFTSAVGKEEETEKGIEIYYIRSLKVSAASEREAVCAHQR